MMKPKQALVKDGFLPAGSENVRGRLSRAAIERCKELAADGWDIEGYEVAASTATDAPKVVNKVKVVPGEKVIADIVYTYPESDFKALNKATGKVLPGKWGGMREVCNNCHVSLVGHGCNAPVVLGDIEVLVVRR